MIDHIGEWKTAATTFRFSSGQILILHEDQIEKIPYLSAIVSSADRFESARDEDGHYKLDPHIDYKYFTFVLESLSFHSVRQLLTCLPKQNDVIPIIAHLDFLGIGPQPDPTLTEVDSTFFSTMVFRPLSKTHLQIVRPSVIQDMAVRFAIAMAKEEYDFTKREVIDQIYWFIMFILSAYELFGSRLRHHVCKIAEHCFSLFKPSLLKPLDKLILKTEVYVRKLVLTTKEEDVGPDEENKPSSEQLLDLDYDDWSYAASSFWAPVMERQEDSLGYQIYTYDNWFRYRKKPPKRDLLEPVYERVLEVMYARLQNEISQRAMVELRKKKKNPHEFVRRRIFLLFRLSYDIVERKVLPEIIHNIFKSELVQEEIREYILQQICVLTPKLEERRAKLVKQIQEYEHSQEILHENNFYYPVVNVRFNNLETIREKALSHQLILDKLHQGSNLVEQIHQRVLDALYEVALRQFRQWEDTQQYINELRYLLKPCRSSEKSLPHSLKTMHQHHRISVNKPLPKHQLKYSTR